MRAVTGGILVDLTARQRAFLRQFMELYREARAPLHYSLVAEKLKLSSISAYDMLRVLKRRGVVASQYLLPKKRPGPGRSTIVFYPTQQAADVFDADATDEADGMEWEELRDRILRAIRKGKGEYDQILSELLSRMPRRKSPLLYSTEMVAAIVLQICQLKEETRVRLLKHARALMASEESGLTALAGLPVGFTLAEEVNRGFTDRLLSQVGKYQKHLERLSARSKKALSEFFLELVRTVEGEKV
jgi:energy-coupling factor transport system substrate-specific component